MLIILSIKTFFPSLYSRRSGECSRYTWK